MAGWNNLHLINYYSHVKKNNYYFLSILYKINFPIFGLLLDITLWTEYFIFCENNRIIVVWLYFRLKLNHVCCLRYVFHF